MTAEEKRAFEKLSPERRDAEILSVILDLGGSPLSQADKLFVEKMSDGQREAQIWDAASDIPVGGAATGDAAVGDVKAGKTFSSALLSGATGTAVISSGNAAAGDVREAKTFSNATTAGVTGTAIISTGDAVAADVAEGKTFSNGAVAGLTGTAVETGLPFSIVNEAGLGGITDMVDGSVAMIFNGADASRGFHYFEGDWHELLGGFAAPITITPYVAWEEFMRQAYDASTVGALIDLSDVNMTHLDSGVFALWLQTVALFTAGPISFLPTDCALNATDVDGVIEKMALLGTGADTLNISGGTNAAPTLSAGRVNGTWVITITGTPVGSIELRDNVTNGSVITFGTDVDVSSANANTIAANLKDFIDSLLLDWVVTRVNAVVTVTVSNDIELPLLASDDSATNLTIADTAGNPSYIGQIEARGGTVTHN